MSAPPRPQRRAPPPVPTRRPDYTPMRRADYTPMYRTPYTGGMYNMYTNSYGSTYNSYNNRYPLNNFVRLAEDSSRPAFESMENIVQAFGSIAMVLESTSFAVQSSFRAVLGLAEHFSRLKLQLSQMVASFTLVRTLRYLYRKLLALLRIRREELGQEEDVWSELASGDGLFGGKGRRKSSWPLLLFFCIVIGGPVIIYRLMSSLNEVSGEPSWLTEDGEHYVAVAEYDYDAENEDEVSLTAGHELRVAPKDLQPRVRGWLLASADGEKAGLIPANYVRIRGRRPARTEPRAALHSQVWTDVSVKPQKNECETSSESEAGSPLPSVDSALGSDHKETEVT